MALKILCCITLYCLYGYTYCQKEANTWYIEKGLGLDFNYCPPKLLDNGARETIENTACISDPITGELLFYTNTASIYNRNHQVMLNGRLKDSLGTTVTQTAIVPHPNKDSANLFFVFTCPAQSQESTDSFICYVVDLSEDGGLGAVVRRIALTGGPLNEKVVSIRAADKKSFWVITHAFKSNTFYAFNLDQNGLNTTPVLSHTGDINPDERVISNLGVLTASPDGSKLCYLSFTDTRLQVYKFNFSNGIISDYLSINPPHTDTLPNTQLFVSGFYGASFSPDSRLLYAAPLFTNNSTPLPSYIYQFDISSWDKTSIEQSVYCVHKAENINKITTRYTQLKLAPDGKLYVGMRNLYTYNTTRSDTIPTCFPVIHHPNIKGAGCEFDNCYISYIPALYGKSYTGNITGTFGLSNLFEINDYIPANTREYGLFTATDTAICGNRLTYKLNVKDNYFNTVWEDGQQGNAIEINHAGTYRFTVYTEKGCKWDSGSVVITDKSNVSSFIEDAFSPDNDNINDVFPSQDFSALPFKTIEIYNRWGEKIYTGDNMKWDGRYKDEPCPEGIYIYKITYINCDNRPEILTGNITLIR